jgi:hypothetical protein
MIYTILTLIIIIELYLLHRLNTKYNALEAKYWMSQNTIAEYDDENRKMRDREAIDENTRFSKKKI